jgi:hypothetical protein
VRLGLLLLGLLIFGFAAAQEPKKKPTAKKPQTAHKKATPDQIRKFNQLEKQQKK